MVGLANFADSKFQQMANWPSFDFFYRNGVNCAKQAACLYISPSFDFLIEARPVGHPLEFEPAKSANPTRFLFKIDQ